MCPALPRFVIYNGQLKTHESLALPASNRAFRYGDGVFESLRADHHGVWWAQRHFSRLEIAARLLKVNMPEELSFAGFLNDFDTLYRASFPDKGPARFRLSLFRQAGGLYTPESRHADYLIEAIPLNNDAYRLSRQGKLIDLCPDYPLISGVLSSLKSISSLTYVMAGLYASNKGLDDVLLLNQNGNLAEAVSSNLFVVFDNNLLTPGLDQACVAGIMRSIVIELAREQGLRVKETPISPNALEEADEIFLTNAIQGISWVKGFKNKRYIHCVSDKLLKALNQALISRGKTPFNTREKPL